MAMDKIEPVPGARLRSPSGRDCYVWLMCLLSHLQMGLLKVVRPNRARFE